MFMRGNRQPGAEINEQILGLQNNQAIWIQARKYLDQSPDIPTYVYI